jgi:hypothetical protein
MKVADHKLRAKGWTEEEIDKVKAIIEKAENNKKAGTYFLEHFVYWLALVLTIIGTFLFSLVLIPLIMGAATWAIYLITAFVGFVFGALFTVLLIDIEHLNAKHHVFNSIILPVTAIINLVLIINVANGLVEFAELGPTQSYVGISIVYVVMLLGPYVFNLINKKRVEKNVLNRVEH